MINKDIVGNLFTNNYKTKETQPDYKGKGEYPDGKPFEIAGWIKKDKNGNDFISFVIREPYVAEVDSKDAPKTSKAIYEESKNIDDDLPF